MAAHYWLFPWIALAAGLAAVGVGASARGAGPSDANMPRLPRPLLVLWLVVGVAATLGSLRTGAVAGFDVIAARGMLLGLLGGAGLVALCRRATVTGALAPLVLGWGTAMVAAGRLWLTHAEISGLTALALGVALSVLCLGLTPFLSSPTDQEEEGRVAWASTLGLLYALSLAAAVALGFTRADTLGDMFRADIPLLLGTALSLGAVVASGLERRDVSTTPLASLFPLLAALIVLVPLSRLTHSWRPLETLGLGMICFGLLRRLALRPDSPNTETATSEDALLGPLAGSVLLVSGGTLAFALWSGYGLGLFVLGGWFVGGPMLLTHHLERPGGLAAGFAFGALLLLYRLTVLQDNVAVHAIGPGDTWDLLAISLGALLPLAAAEWARQDGRAGPLAPWAVTVQWLLTLALPALILDYVWQPRSVAGVLLGAALGQLLSGASSEARGRFPAVALSGAVLGLVLFQFLPVLGHVDAPSRSIRVALVLSAAALLALRLLVPGRTPRRVAA